MAIGGIMLNDKRAQQYTPTYPYMQINVYFAIPKGMPYATFAKIVMPFSRIVWISILSTVILAILLIILTKNIPFIDWQYDSHPGLLLDVLNTLLGGSIVKTPIRNYARVGLAVWLLATLVLRNAYLGSMFKFLQAQILAIPVDTIEKIIEYNYTVYAVPMIYTILYDIEPRLQNQLCIFT